MKVKVNNLMNFAIEHIRKIKGVTQGVLINELFALCQDGRVFKYNPGEKRFEEVEFVRKTKNRGK